MKQITVIFNSGKESIQVEYLKGDNQDDNDKIIDYSKNTGNRDIWFHIKDTPSSHIVALMPNSASLPISTLNDIITKGCMLYFEYNAEKYKNTKTLDIMYTEIQNVSKTKTKGLVNVTNQFSKKITKDTIISSLSNELVITKYKLVYH